MGRKMSMRLEMCCVADLLEVRATGDFSLDEAKRTFLEMMDAVALQRTKRVLFDGRTMTGNPATMERFYYAEFAAATAAQSKTLRKSSNTQFAYVLKEPVLDSEKFGETVAVNRGMFVKAFDNLEDALAWLEMH
jgi:hypothetical protein